MKKFTVLILICFLNFCNYSYSDIYDYKVYSPNEYTNSQTNYNAEKIVFIVDFSNSMNETVGGKRKIDIALDALKEILPKVSQNTQIGLRVYGHRSGLTPIDACMASKLAINIGYNNAKKIYEALERITPTGMTPITYSIKQSLKNDFGLWQGRKRLIILTDGGENCDESPCEYALNMLRKRSDVKIDVIAFSLSDESALKQLRCASLVTNGKFYTADTYSDLVKSLEKSFNAQKSVEAKILTK